MRNQAGSSKKGNRGWESHQETKQKVREKNTICEKGGRKPPQKKKKKKKTDQN